MHNVDVGDAIPIKQHPYRYLPHKNNVAQEKVDYMLQIGITEPADSAWYQWCWQPRKERQTGFVWITESPTM